MAGRETTHEAPTWRGRRQSVRGPPGARKVGEVPDPSHRLPRGVEGRQAAGAASGCGKIRVVRLSELIFVVVMLIIFELVLLDIRDELRLIHRDLHGSTATLATGR